MSLNSRIPNRQNKCQFVSISIITGQELTPKKKNRESNFSTFKGCAPFFLSRSSYFCVESRNRIISKIAFLYRHHKVSNTAPWTWKLYLLVMLWVLIMANVRETLWNVYTTRWESCYIGATLGNPSDETQIFLSISCLSETESQKLNFEAFWRPHDTKQRSQPKPFNVSYRTRYQISPFCSLTLSMCSLWERFLANQVKLHGFARNFPKYTWRASSCRKEWSNNLPVKAPVQKMLFVVK